MRTARFAIALLLGAAPVAASADPTPPAPASETYEAAVQGIRATLEKGKVEDRGRALERAGAIADARSYDLVLDGIAKEEARRVTLAKSHTETGLALQTAISEIEKLNAEHPTTPREIEAYNLRVAKSEAKRDTAIVRLKDLSAEASSQRRVFRSGTSALARVLDALSPAVAGPLIEKLTASWTGSKSTTADRLRWVDVLSAVRSVPTAPRLRTAAVDPAGDLPTRVAALSAFVTRGEATATADCVAVLVEPITRWPVIAEAIEGLRRLHQREAIEPLVTFLARQPIGRLREDAHHALLSLTGARHGPYAEPWFDWWHKEKATFVMPATPADVYEVTKPDKGLTFYGVTTHSDHVILVLDVSGSMLDLAHPDGAGVRATERRIDLARKELAGALAMLDPRKTFEIVFFNHKVQRLVGMMAPAEPGTVEKAKKFALAFEPTGGTNIHDSLEVAFQAAGAPTVPTAGKLPPAVADTIYFMTDGKPTAGKQQEPDAILEDVRDWNRTARMTIHTIAVGDKCDEKFLETLAKENRGRFVKR